MIGWTTWRMWQEQSWDTGFAFRIYLGIDKIVHVMGFSIWKWMASVGLQMDGMRSFPWRPSRLATNGDQWPVVFITYLLHYFRIPARHTAAISAITISQNSVLHKSRQKPPTPPAASHLGNRPWINISEGEITLALALAVTEVCRRVLISCHIQLVDLWHRC